MMTTTAAAASLAIFTGGAALAVIPLIPFLFC